MVPVTGALKGGRVSERGSNDPPPPPPRTQTFFLPPLGHNLLRQFFSLGSSKVEISETDFFDILTTQNDQISYVKHVFDPIHVLFTLFGRLDGGKGLGHKVLWQFSTLGSSKIEIFETGFFGFLTIHHDRISWVKHVLDPLHVFFTVLGCCRRDGGF